MYTLFASQSAILNDNNLHCSKKFGARKGQNGVGTKKF